MNARACVCNNSWLQSLHYSVYMILTHRVSAMQFFTAVQNHHRRNISSLSNLLFSHSLATNVPNGKSKDFIVKCPYEDTNIPETNFYSHIFQHFPKYGKKIALIDGVTGREYSYNENRSQLLIWRLVW